MVFLPGIGEISDLQESGAKESRERRASFLGVWEWRFAGHLGSHCSQMFSGIKPIRLRMWNRNHYDLRADLAKPKRWFRCKDRCQCRSIDHTFIRVDLRIWSHRSHRSMICGDLLKASCHSSPVEPNGFSDPTSCASRTI